MSDCKSPAWDAGGKYLYFLSSTDYGLNVGWLDLSSLERPVKRAIYLAVLSDKEPSPLLPESDDESTEEKAKNEEKNSDKEDKKVDVKIDFTNINQRIIALNIPARDFQDLKCGKEGTLFYMETIPNLEGFKLHRYVLKDREAKDILNEVYAYDISYDGEKLLYAQKDNQWYITDANSEIKAGEGKINTESMQMKVEPMAEWKQIFREAWRFQRDYFYVKNVHGLDLDWAYKTYAPWVEHVKHRSDLIYILDILGGETAIGHSFTGGGDLPDVERVPVGLLGADYKIENSRFRIEKIYDGENWNPDLRSPLSCPGIDVREGDYLVMVNGAELTDKMNLYSLFDQTADKQLTIKVNDKPQLEGARQVTVVPVSDETGLRRLAWVEENRHTVDKLSGGKLAYVWLPNTSVAGYQYFNRYYFAQNDKKGAVIDERFNGGGYIADYIVDLLSRDLLGYFNNPIGNNQPFLAPNAALYGPKVMIINDAAGSGGDMLPYMFRLKKIGPLVGTRTWGGLVGIWDVPALIDGGYITAPRGGFYNLQGEWDVENKGVAPDIEVEQIPKLVNQGHDPQLEEAVETALKLLESEEMRLLPQPADPVRVKRPQ
jgi:tricorn protease